MKVLAPEVVQQVLYCLEQVLSYRTKQLPRKQQQQDLEFRAYQERL